MEAQLANLADEIAYNHHDIDDGIRAGLLSEEALRDLELFGMQYVSVCERYPGLVGMYEDGGEAIAGDLEAEAADDRKRAGPRDLLQARRTTAPEIPAPWRPMPLPAYVPCRPSPSLAQPAGTSRWR